ncbi:MAG: heme exporter protein CcmD [Beijerinckiaceae bacterium]
MSNHWNFVIASYGVTVVAVGGLIGWLVHEHRTLKQRLAMMEAQRAKNNERAS